MKEARTPVTGGISRRTLATTAWAVPAVAMVSAAPDIAASASVLCSTLTPVTLNYGTSYGTAWSSTTLSGVTMSGSSDLPIATSNTTPSGIRSAFPTSNMFVRQSTGADPTNIGAMGLSTSYLSLQQRGATDNGTYQTLTITFSQAVYGLTFTIVDIDTISTYHDIVSISTNNASATYTYTFKKAAAMTGAGSWGGTWATSNPWTSTVANTDYANPTSTTSTSGDGNVTVKYGSDSTMGITTLKVYYGSSAGGGGTQAILLSPMTFYTQACL